ncbi:MAG: WG repeat-containing protein [Niabella sp.]
MKLKLIPLLILIVFNSFGQDADTWVAYNDKEGYLFGYKNLKGQTMTPPRFMGFSAARKFDKIAVLMEDNNGKFDSYYMLKDGTKFGRDSLYVSDMTFDCESEGLIKFRDPKTDKVGMFNEFGKVAIPAEYNDITRFKNGLAIGLKNARRAYWDKEENHSDCNHWSWVEGKEVLINKNNEILVDGFPLNENIDFYSLIISDKPAEDSIRANFLGTDKKYYSFIDNQKLFNTFLQTKLLNDLSLDNLMQHSYSDIVYWSENTGWNTKPKEKFLKDNAHILKERLSLIRKKGTKYFISIDDFTPMPDEMEAQFDAVRDNCGNWNSSKYPIYNTVVTHNDLKGKFLFQDHFTFLKINDRIQFISCSIKNAHIK